MTAYPLSRMLPVGGVAARMILVLATAAAISSRCAATELTGICMFACGPSSTADACDPGDSSSVAWHTERDDVAAPLALFRSLPPRSYGLPPVNPFAQLSYPLTIGKQIFTFIWQPIMAPFPLRYGVNFFFNGDDLLPGITADVPILGGLGFTYFRPNLSATTVSMYLREVENPATVSYSDGQSVVTLTALLIAPPNTFATVDRIGLTGFAPDHYPDAVGIIELTVSAAAQSTPGSLGSAGVPSDVGAPAALILGPDERPIATPGPLLTTPSPPASRPTESRSPEAEETPTAGTPPGSPGRTPSPPASRSATAPPTLNATPLPSRSEPVDTEE
jgi:hypothetical protein